MINRQGKMYFGIKAQNVDSDLSEKNDIPMGIYISMVESDSPAYQAGLQPGDIIQGINKMPCYTMQRLNDKLCDSAHGQVINVSIKRKGKSGYFDVSYDVSVELR
jgi:serine protease Do